MPFDLSTAIAVRERPDGLLEKDTFDLSTAQPVTEIRAARTEEIRYSPPLSDEQKAQAVVELSYKQSGEKMPIGLKADWVLTSQPAKMITANILGAIATGGVIPFYNAVRGIANAESPNSDIGKMIFDSAYKGLAENETVQNLGGAAAKAYPDAPWQITGAMGALAEVLMFMPGIAKAGANLLSKDQQFTIALNNARQSPKWGDLVGQVAQKSKQPVEIVDQALYNKLWEIRGEADYFKVLNGNLKKVSGIDLLSEAGSIPINRAKVGQSVNFTDPQGLVKSGVIKEITGERAIIDLEGREVVATLSQLSVPEPTTGEGKVLFKGVGGEQPNINQFAYGTHYADNPDLAYKYARTNTPQDIQVVRIKPDAKIIDLEEIKLQYAQEMKMADPKVITEKLKSEGYDIAKAKMPDGQYEYIVLNDKAVEPLYKPKATNKQLLASESYDTQAIKDAQKMATEQLAQGKKDLANVALGRVKALREDILKERALAQPTGQQSPVVPSKIKPSVLPTSQVKKAIRESTGQIKVGDIIGEPEALKRMFKREEQISKQIYKQAQSDLMGDVETSENLKKMFGDMADEAQKEEEKLLAGAMKQFFRYEDDIAKLEEEVKVSNFNTEAEKVKAEYKLENLKQEYAQAREAQRQKKVLRDEVSSLVKNIQSSPSESISIEYQDMIEEIKSKFDLKNRQEETLAKREGMKSFVERMKVEGKSIDIPKEKLELLDKVNLKNMTLDQLRQIDETISTLEKLGKTKQKARDAVYQNKKEKIVADISKKVSPINSKVLPKLPIGKKPDEWAKRYIGVSNYLQKTKTGLTAIEGLADITGMQRMKRELDKKFSEYLNYNDKEIDQWYALTKDSSEESLERIGAYAIAQQEGGLERLANSGIAEQEIKNIKLTLGEQKIYKFVRDTFESFYPGVKKYAREVYNEDVGKVENYVSFISDTEAMNDLELYDRFGQRPEMAFGKMTKTVEQGFRKERAKTSNIKLQLNIDKIFRRHLDDVAYMLTMGKDIKMYYEIVNTPEMRERLGDVGTLAWLQWLDLMARKGGSEGAKRLAALDILRRNIGAGTLAFRLSSALVQFSSFGDTMATIGAEWATKGATNIATSKDWRNFVMDNFPEVKKAVGDDIAYRELGEDFLGKLARVGLTPLQALDGLMRSTAVVGSYMKLARDKGVTVDLKNPDPELIQEATKLMRQAQGSSFFKDQPLSITTGFGLLENRSLNKTALTFQSFMLSRWDNISRQIWRMGVKENKYPKAIMSALWLLIFGFAAEEGLRRSSRGILSIASADAREEKPFAGEVGLNAVQAVPLLGQLVSSINYSSNPVPVINTVEDIISGSGIAVKGKTSETRLKGFLKILGGLGSLKGIAGSSQVSQIFRGMISKGKKKGRW